ncbi:unnamed protein product, partial [Closterium sp. NIES-54]
VYFAPPGSDVYSIPSKLAPLPSQPIRCQVGRWTYIAGKILAHSTDPYKPSAKEIEEVTKVFFIRHLNDVPYGTREFMLDFEEVYVFDGHDKTLRRANVILDVLEDQPRDLRNETLIVRDDGNTFRIIPKVRGPWGGGCVASPAPPPSPTAAAAAEGGGCVASSPGVEYSGSPASLLLPVARGSVAPAAA